MKRPLALCLALLIVSVLLLSGCSSPKKSSVELYDEFIIEDLKVSYEELQVASTSWVDNSNCIIDIVYKNDAAENLDEAEHRHKVYRYNTEKMELTELFDGYEPYSSGNSMCFDVFGFDSHGFALANKNVILI